MMNKVIKQAQNNNHKDTSSLSYMDTTNLRNLALFPCDVEDDKGDDDLGTGSGNTKGAFS